MQLRRTQAKWMKRDRSGKGDDDIIYSDPLAIKTFHIDEEDDRDGIPMPTSPSTPTNKARSPSHQSPSHRRSKIQSATSPSTRHPTTLQKISENETLGPTTSKVKSATDPDSISSPRNAASPSSFSPTFSAMSRQISTLMRMDSMSVSTEVIDSIHPILDKIKAHMGSEDIILAKTQAFIRGNIERTHLLLGTVQFRERLHRMSAKLSVLIEGMRTNPITGKQEVINYPVFIRVKPSWMGMIRLIHVYDISNNRFGVIKLQTPFAPMKDTVKKLNEYHREEKLHLSIEYQKIVTNIDLENIQPPSITSTENTPRPLGEGGEEKKANNEERQREYCFLILKFSNDTSSSSQKAKSSSYYYRRVLLKYDESKKTDINPNYKPNNTLVAVVERFNEGKVNELIRLQQLEEERLFVLEKQKKLAKEKPHLPILKLPQRTATSTSLDTMSALSAYSSALKSLSGGGGADDTSTILSSVLEHKISLESYTSSEIVVIRTTIFKAFLLRDVYKDHYGNYYLISVMNSHDVTQVNFLQFSTNHLFSFYMLREFIDRSQLQSSTPQLKKKWEKLFRILLSQPSLLNIVINDLMIEAQHQRTAFCHPEEDFQDSSLPPLSPLISSPNHPKGTINYEAEAFEQRKARIPPRHPNTTTSEDLQEFTFQISYQLTAYAKIQPNKKGINIVLIHQQRKPILGNAFEVYEETEEIRRKRLEAEYEPIEEEPMTFQSLLFPLLVKQPSYQTDFFQEMMMSSHREGLGIAAMASPFPSITDEGETKFREPSFIASENVNPEEFPIYHLPEETPMTDIEKEKVKVSPKMRRKSSQNIRHSAFFTSADSNSLYQDSDMSGLRVGGDFDNEESDSLITFNNKGNNGIFPNMDGNSIVDLLSHNSLEGGGITGENEEPAMKGMILPLDYSGSGSMTMNINQLIQNIKEQEEEKERQRQEELRAEEERRREEEARRLEEENRLYQEEMRRQKEEAQMTAEEQVTRDYLLAVKRRKFIQDYSISYSTDLIRLVERKLVTEAFTNKVLDIVVDDLVKRSVTSFLTSRTALFVTKTALTTATIKEGLIDAVVNELIEIIMNEEISWDVLLLAVFNHFLHSLVKDVVNDGIEDIVQENEEKKRLEEELEAKRVELRKKAYYPKKIRSMVNEQSHYQLNKKDPALVPVNAWTEEFSVFSTVSPTGPTKTMSAARHRDQARAVVFHNESTSSVSRQSNNSVEEENKKHPRPHSSSSIPRPNTSSSVKQASAQIYTSPQALVKALRANSYDDFDSPHSRSSTPTRPLSAAPSVVITADNVHPHITKPPVISHELSLELSTVDGFDPKKRDVPKRLLQSRPTSAAPVLIGQKNRDDDAASRNSNRQGDYMRSLSSGVLNEGSSIVTSTLSQHKHHLQQARHQQRENDIFHIPPSNAVSFAEEDEEDDDEEEELEYLPNPITNSNKDEKARPKTTEELAMYKDKQSLYESSLKQIHRLGFAPSSKCSAYLDLADGQPVRRPWEYTAYWQQLLTAFVKYHANLPSIKVSATPSIPTTSGVRSRTVSEDFKNILPMTDSVEEIQSISYAYGFDDKEAFEIFADRPPFWLLKKQLTILHRAIPPEKFHAIRLHHGFKHLPRYELIKTKNVHLDEQDNQPHYIASPATILHSPTASSSPGKHQGEVRGGNNKRKMKGKGNNNHDSSSKKLIEKEPTVEQLICCLAECRGSIGEVIQKVKILEFMKEIELVCDAINVKALVCSISSDAESLFPSLKGKKKKDEKEEEDNNNNKSELNSHRGGVSSVLTSSSSTQWEDSSTVLERIIHRRNEEIKIYNQTRKRESTQLLQIPPTLGGGGGGSGGGGGGNEAILGSSINRSSDGKRSPGSAKIVRRNSSLVLTDFESDESFVLALQKVLAKGNQMANIQRSILATSEDVNQSHEGNTKTVAEGGGGGGDKSSHVPTGLMILPRVGNSSVARTSLDATSAIIRSRASFFSSGASGIAGGTGTTRASSSSFIPFDHHYGDRSTRTSFIHNTNDHGSTRSSMISTAGGGGSGIPPTASKSTSFVNKLRHSSTNNRKSMIDFIEVGERKDLVTSSSPPITTVRGGKMMDDDTTTGNDSMSLMIGFPDNSTELPPSTTMNHYRPASSLLTLSIEEGEREMSPQRKRGTPQGKTTPTHHHHHHLLMKSGSAPQHFTLTRGMSGTSSPHSPKGVMIDGDNTMMTSYQRPKSSSAEFMMNAPTRKGSYHFEKYLIEEAFRPDEITEFTILTRRDAMKLEKEETLLKSNKLYLRQPIEKKIEILSKRSLSTSLQGNLNYISPSESPRPTTATTVTTAVSTPPALAGSAHFFHSSNSHMHTMGSTSKSRRNLSASRSGSITN